MRKQNNKKIQQLGMEFEELLSSCGGAPQGKVSGQKEILSNRQNDACRERCAADPDLILS